MSDVTRMCNVSIDGKVGFMLPDNVWSEVRGAILRVLAKHEGELVMCDWTLNDTWRKDGGQVIMHFPANELYWSHWNIADRIEAVAGARSIEMRVELFTDEADREKVAELCGMVARGEIEVDA